MHLACRDDKQHGGKMTQGCAWMFKMIFVLLWVSRATDFACYFFFPSSSNTNYVIDIRDTPLLHLCRCCLCRSNSPPSLDQPRPLPLYHHPRTHVVGIMCCLFPCTSDALSQVSSWYACIFPHHDVPEWVSNLESISMSVSPWVLSVKEIVYWMSSCGWWIYVCCRL